LEELNAKLEEAGGVSAAQVEITKKREAELVKLKRDLEDANLQYETNAQQLKQKSQTALAELVEQIDQLQTAKNKLVYC
jgi:DNA repair exonuclease SbcCD ATPase subunit